MIRVTFAAMALLFVIVAACGSDDDDGGSPTASAPAGSAPADASASPTPTRAPTQAPDPGEAFPGIDLPDSAELTSENTATDTVVEIPYEADIELPMHTVLTNKVYSVNESEGTMTQFYSEPPEGWTQINDDYPIVWITDEGRRAIWIYILPGSLSISETSES